MTYSVDAPAVASAGRQIEVFDLTTADAASLARWAERLPMADVGASSQSVFETLQVLNECPLEPKLRFQLLEVLRPVLCTICNSLAARYHSQPIVLPPKSFQVYLLSQAMQRQMIDGYQLVAEDAARQIERRRFKLGKKKALELCARACHRAMADMTRALFRGSLIYRDSDPGFWRQLHGLYRYALNQGIADQAFEDPQATQACHLSTEQCYLKALLLGTVRSNQLRQEDLSVVFDRIDEWVTLTALAPFDSTDEDRLAVDLDSDEPPVYVAQFATPAATGNCRLLVMDELLYHLSDLLSADHKSHLSRNLIKHLLISWGSHTARTFMRMDSSDSLALCVGLSDLHYFVAGVVEFESIALDASPPALVPDEDGNPFLRTQGIRREALRDVWSAPFRPSAGSASLSLESIDSHIQQYRRQRSSEAPKRQHDNYDIRMVNVSPGGYGLEWPSDQLAKLSNGDLVGIRETKRANWSVGVVSWIQRNGDSGTQLGVKLLGSAVVPFAARPLNPKSDRAHSPSDYSRALLLPAIKSIGQPASLITTQRTFREQQGLLLVQQGREWRVRLTRLILSTGAMSQFEIEFLEKPGRPAGSAQGEAFSSLWGSI